MVGTSTMSISDTGVQTISKLQRFKRDLCCSMQLLQGSKILLYPPLDQHEANFCWSLSPRTKVDLVTGPARKNAGPGLRNNGIFEPCSSPSKPLSSSFQCITNKTRIDQVYDCIKAEFTQEAIDIYAQDKKKQAFIRLKLDNLFKTGGTVVCMIYNLCE